MKIPVSAIGATAAFLAAGTQTASAQRVECTGPLRQCIIDIGAWCEREPNGKTVIIYVDRGGRSMRFEECVGRLYEERGLPNPYKPASQKPAARR